MLNACVTTNVTPVKTIVTLLTAAHTITMCHVPLHTCCDNCIHSIWSQYSMCVRLYIIVDLAAAKILQILSISLRMVHNRYKQEYLCIVMLMYSDVS